MRTPTPLSWALAALLAAGCGVLEGPDLGHGRVTGRIPGAAAGAYAYVFGYPDVFAMAQPDGTFELEAVPAGAQRLVVFDGGVRAGLVKVTIEGSEENAAEIGALPLSCAIQASAVPATGAILDEITFTLEGTRLRAVPGAGGVRLFPVPPGTHMLRASEPGFRDARVTIDLYGEGIEWPQPVQLEIDTGSPTPGCNACGTPTQPSGCEPGLQCNPVNGRCDQCRTSADCSGGALCASGVCVAGSGSGTGTLCQACQSPADCGGALGPPLCVGTNANGAPVQTKYCSYDCNETCPSGYRCVSLGQSVHACEPPVNCTALLSTFGLRCASANDPACMTALDGGKCFMGTEEPYCTASCLPARPCPTGYHCDAAFDACRKDVEDD